MDKMVKEMIMFSNVYKGKKVLITGNTGFKGSWLTVWLEKLGADIYGISKDIPTEPSMFKELDLEKKITHYYEDIRNLSRMVELVQKIKPDFVFHLAAQALVSVSYSNPIDTLETNVLGTANILEALRLSNHKCVAVIITSDKCYNNVEWVWGYKETDSLGGKDIYSGSKGAAELIINSYFQSFFKEKSNIRICTARAGNVIGGGDWAKDRVVPDCIRAWNTGKTVEIRSPKSTRPWQHVLEPLSGYLTLGMFLYNDLSLNGESFNFGPHAQINKSVEDLLKTLAQHWSIDDPEKAFTIQDSKPFDEAGLLRLNCDKALLRLKWIPTLDYETLTEFTSMWYYDFYKTKQNILDITNQQLEKYCSIAFDKKQEWVK